MRNEALDAVKTEIERLPPGDEREEIYQRALLAIIEVVQQHEDIVGPMYVKQMMKELRARMGVPANDPR
jgi:hypothetical protein